MIYALKPDPNCPECKGTGQVYKVGGQYPCSMMSIAQCPCVLGSSPPRPSPRPRSGPSWQCSRCEEYRLEIERLHRELGRLLRPKVYDTTHQE